MKQLVSGLILLGLTISVADARPGYVRPDEYGGYRVTYNYTDKQKTGWYATVRAEMNLLNWTNEYDTNYGGAVSAFSKDKYSMETLFGGSIAIGQRFAYFWRGELEVGYTGNFRDADSNIEFNFRTPYALANLMYDFPSGLYLGGGVGLAFPTTTWDWDGFIPDRRLQSDVSLMAGPMIGFTHKLDDNFVLDFRYRLAGFLAGEQTRNFEDHSGSGYYFKNKMGLVLDNSLSIALRYEF